MFAAYNVQPNDALRNRAHVVAVNAGANAPALPLENHAGIVSPPLPNTLAERLRRRFAMQRAAARLLPQYRVAQCMTRPASGTGGVVTVLYHPSRQRASFGNLQTCGSPHVCPVCASKIAERRAEEVTTAYDRWTARGGAVLLLTLTLRHSRNDRLDYLLGVMNEAYRRMRSGSKWIRWRDRLGIRGSITAREYTHGNAGWHPHLHALIFVEHTGPWLDEFVRWVKHTWLNALASLGASGVTTAQDLRVATSRDQSEYVTKLGHGVRWSVGDELTKLNSKRGRAGNATPWDLLADASHGDADAARLWVEYAEATFGRNALAWSPNLRDFLEMEPELSDEEIAAQQTDDAVVLAILDASAWRRVLAVEARAELLIVASSGDAGAVRQMLLELLE